MDTLIYTPTLERLSQLQNGTSPASVFHIHSNLALALPCFKDAIFEKVIIELSTVNELSQFSFHSLYSVLKPNGSLRIHFTTPQMGSDPTLKDVYTIAGFKEETSEVAETLLLRKPTWAGKGAVSLKKRNVNLNGNSNGTSVKLNTADEDVVFNNAPKVEKMDVEKSEPKKANPFAKFSVQASTEGELINEDNLLDNEESYKPLATADDSCSTKAKACANCSCGRAELEAQAEIGGADVVKNIETGKVQSSCGSCYLGDAFRCASCPYKGLPAFKPGDKVKLDLSKDGLGGVLNEGNKVVVSNGKVKLQI